MLVIRVPPLPSQFWLLVNKLIMARTAQQPHAHNAASATAMSATGGGGADLHRQQQVSKFASAPGAVTALRVNYTTTDRAFTNPTNPRLASVREEVRQIASGPALGDKPTWNSSVHEPGSDLPQRATRAANSAYQGVKIEYNFRAATLPPVNQFIYVPKPDKMKVDESKFLTAAERARVVKTCLTTNIGLSRKEFANNLASGAVGVVDPLREALGCGDHILARGGVDADAFATVGCSPSTLRGVRTDVGGGRGWNASTLPDEGGLGIMCRARSVPPGPVVASDATPVTHDMYTQKNKSRTAQLLGLPLASASKGRSLGNNGAGTGGDPAPHDAQMNDTLLSSQHQAMLSSASRSSSLRRQPTPSANINVDVAAASKRHEAGTAYIPPMQRQQMLIDSLRSVKLETRHQQQHASGGGASEEQPPKALTMRNRHEWADKCPVDVAGARAQIAASQVKVPFGGASGTATADTQQPPATVAVPPSSSTLGRHRRTVRYPSARSGTKQLPGTNSEASKHNDGSSDGDDSDNAYILEDEYDDLPLQEHQRPPM